MPDRSPFDSGHVLKNDLAKLVILGAGRPFRGDQHSVLRSASGQSRVLDWVLQAARSVVDDVHFVGGYQLDEICRVYPDIQYSVNPAWQSTGAAASLLTAPLSASGRYVVSYADVLFRSSSIQTLAASDADVAVAVDSQWRQRFEGRSQADLERCEKVNLHGSQITRLGRDILPATADAEFVGLVSFGSRVAEYLAAQGASFPEEIRRGNLSQLLELLRVRGFSIEAVDVEGDWAEMNEPQDLTRFIMGTKAQTLRRLQGLITHSRIEDQVSFTVAEWQSEPQGVLERIRRKLGARALVVRSSALTEDGFASANAGAYTSVLGVDGASPEAVKTAIAEVAASYPDNDPRNQVLVQPMVDKVCASGVAFTRTLAHGAPYYVINYDDITRSTESITSGASRDHKTLLVYRGDGVEGARLPRPVDKLLPALRELEGLLDYDSLDVEFAISEGGQVHVLQVRPIAVEHEENDAGAVDAVLQQAMARFRRAQAPSPFVVGEKAYFGVMPDWNPAEIIGTRPGRLAMSLYRFLIMDDIWATQRAEYGYRDVRPQPLLTAFAGHPYVDIRASFNSFIPATLGDDLAGRLVDFYLDWLRKHPHLHDKVEFDVVPTCFALDFERWRQRLTNEGGFAGAEVEALESGLKAVTAGAFERTPADLAAVDTLEARFQRITERDLPPLERALVLLEDCRSLGTRLFAHLARSAFVAVTLLRSAVSAGLLDQEAVDAFLNSIRTVTHRFTDDAAQTASGALAWETFVERYGHLRPGTYDITSLSYADDPEHFLRPVVERASGDTAVHADTAAWDRSRSAFAEALGTVGLPGDIEVVEGFMRAAIEGREYAKFVFTRHLSAALDALVEFGQSRGLDREALSHIPLGAFRDVSAGTVSEVDETAWLTGEAERGRHAQQRAGLVELPPLLLDESDFRVFLYPSSQANFVGSGRITASCLALNKTSPESGALEGRIALIPQADPGYDWLFGQGIAGLITMYGGANSHMAIRAAEFGLPAAIGVGEARYEALAVASVLELDAANRRIQVVR
ncbi:PEP/pyruvate-binding domain-containing protein [Marinobacter sp. JSM 1782161]|uniref:PEP/pyruvate-binding domain-containing protein n=1 Tax=Marinobacter sp. JSM 1782161 TaxID=2685906 RepID=UPI001402FDA5